MENASKALIIAGAILLAILIISLGVIIYQQAAGVVNKNSMSDIEISTFNSKFTTYEGNVKGSQVNSLLQTIIASNTDENNSDRMVKIDSSTVKLTSDNKGIEQRAINSNTYSVKCNYKNGLVDTITVEDNRK